MFLFRVFIFLLLIIILALIHVFQLLSLLIRPVSETVFRRVNGRLAAFWWELLVKALISLGCISVKCFGQIPNPPDQNVVIIANHQSLIDSLVLLIFAKQMKSLPYLKWFVKDSIGYIPFLGWGLWFIDSIFLRRRWDQDRFYIAETFRKIRSHQDPVWLISFVEGTRLTPEKLIQSQKFAFNQRMDPLEYVLFPRHKGFSAILQGLSGRIEMTFPLFSSRKHWRNYASFLPNPCIAA